MPRPFSMISPNILIGDAPQLFTNYHTALTSSEFLRLRHTKRYYGGAWDLSFFLSDSDFGTGQLNEWFNTFLMGQIAEYYSGAITWTGVIWEMVRVSDGKRQIRTVSDVWNAVKCIYTETDSNVQAETAYQTNQTSIDRYLRKEFIVYKDNVDATQAVDFAEDFLNKHYDSWPKSTDFNVSAEDGLEITALGMGRLFNNFYCTVTTPTGLVDVDAFVDDIWDTDLAPYLPFLSLGGIETNDYEVEREQRTPTRCGDLIDALARAGNNVLPYRWQVDGDFQFRFEKMILTPTLEWHGASRGGITKLFGDVISWNAEPGIMTDRTVQDLPALPGNYLTQRNHELIEQFSMWQGQEQPTPETEEATEATFLSNIEKYQRMITDGNFDRLHTPGSTIAGR